MLLWSLASPVCGSSESRQERPCSLLKTSLVLLVTRRGGKAQTVHKYSAVEDVELTGQVFTVTGDVSAHYYITPGSHLRLGYSGTEKSLL